MISIPSPLIVLIAVFPFWFSKYNITSYSYTRFVHTTRDRVTPLSCGSNFVFESVFFVFIHLIHSFVYRDPLLLTFNFVQGTHDYLSNRFGITQKSKTESRGVIVKIKLISTVHFKTKRFYDLLNENVKHLLLLKIK